MVEITERDINIFRVMSLGVASLEMIMLLLRAAYATSISRGALETRLSRLRSASYVASNLYPRVKKHGNIALYCITPKAASILTSIGHAVEEMRLNLPSGNMARHELAVTETLYAIAWENSLDAYRCTYSDSTVLKHWRGKGSTEPVPDLRLEITFRDGRETNVALEVDMGTIPSYKMAKRLRKLSERGRIILVLCQSNGRIDGLRTACRRVELYYPRLLFGLHGEFKNRGFQDTMLMNVNGEGCYLALQKSAGESDEE